MLEAEHWVAIATVLFLLVLFYLGVHRQLFEALDARRRRIQAELDEARRLKDEAESLVAQYRAKRSEAEKEAEALIANARAEAERYAAEAKAKMEDFVARRTKMAETKITQAEAQALAEVRAAAAEAAVAAAADILSASAKGKVADDLVADGIREVRAKLH
ncbi:MAG TPA: ATP F0F1 synthase subunit B [Xanthobacteraceae bacterium]|nr:ATP F0F1 synthase subunit B [Xanthobacteraceae bacterium]